MEKVLGIGGLFFRSRDPKSLAAWYAKHLGVSPVPSGAGEQPWQQQAGPTAFAPFPDSTTYFGDPTSPHPQQWMIDFRVANLDAFVAQLRAAGITVSDPETYANLGHFARLHDPEGNPIELWQPAAH